MIALVSTRWTQSIGLHTVRERTHSHSYSHHQWIALRNMLANVNIKWNYLDLSRDFTLAVPLTSYGAIHSHVHTHTNAFATKSNLQITPIHSHRFVCNAPHIDTSVIKTHCTKSLRWEFVISFYGFYDGQKECVKRNENARWNRFSVWIDSLSISVPFSTAVSCDDQREPTHTHTRTEL